MYGLLWESCQNAEKEERGRASGKGAPLPGKSPYRLGRVLHDPIKLPVASSAVKVAVLAKRSKTSLQAFSKNKEADR